MRIAVLGPGGVGGLIAALLTRCGQQVTVIAQPSTAETIRCRGIAVESETFGQFTARPAAVAYLQRDVEALIVTCKAVALGEALKRVATEPPLVLPLLNGLDHLAVLRRRFSPDCVTAGSIAVEADRPEPGVVLHSSPFIRINIASEYQSKRSGIARLAAALVEAGIETRVLNSEAEVTWSKLVFLNALACATSAHDKTIGEIRSNAPLRAELVAMIVEASAVARAEGAQIDDRAVIDQFDRMHPTLGSSMQRDIQAARTPELDAIPGAVLRAAAAHNLSCPTVLRLASLVAKRRDDYKSPSPS